MRPIREPSPLRPMAGQDLTELIGNTPLIRLGRIAPRGKQRIQAGDSPSACSAAPQSLQNLASLSCPSAEQVAQALSAHVPHLRGLKPAPAPLAHRASAEPAVDHVAIHTLVPVPLLH